MASIKQMRLLSVLLFASLFLTGCDRSAEESPLPEPVAPAAEGEPAGASSGQPVPSPPEQEPEEAAFEHDPTSQVTVLGYHRFEDPARDGLALTPTEFREQLQELRDLDIEVISMDDFLAWRQGDVNIPAHSAIITIDDGYNCTYHVAWPILQEFDYPFTVYPYTHYISVGGRSITWEQLAEMRDAGVDIGSHSVSHSNLASRGNRSEEEYRQWLTEELRGSKEIIEEQLGIEVTTFAYPYGVSNELARQIGTEAGYDALFNVHGRKITFESDHDTLGRYVVESTKPEVFRMAVNFGTGTGRSLPVAEGATTPANGATIATRQPLLRADLSALGDINPDSVEMSVSGLGVVPATYDPETRTIEYQVRQRIRENPCTVTVRARDGAGQRLETAWSFIIDPTQH